MNLHYAHQYRRNIIHVFFPLLVTRQAITFYAIDTPCKVSWLPSVSAATLLSDLGRAEGALLLPQLEALLGPCRALGS